MLHVDPGFPLTIGPDVTVGHHAILHGCAIGANTLVGMGTTILNGVRIGANCLVGANALITASCVTCAAAASWKPSPAVATRGTSRKSSATRSTGRALFKT